jgi:hypothetical protein
MLKTASPLFALLLINACTLIQDDEYDDRRDADGDGFPASEDCDDSDPDVFPGNSESCDEKDNDCDGLIDENDALDALTWYADTDNDGYGDPDGATLVSCDAPDGYIDNTGDCNDQDPRAYTGATEVCNDGSDNDCDGSLNDCVLASYYTASQLSVKITGSSYYDADFGRRVRWLDDFSAEGEDDVLIGAPESEASDGRLSGSANFLSSATIRQEGPEVKKKGVRLVNTVDPVITGSGRLGMAILDGFALDGSEQAQFLLSQAAEDGLGLGSVFLVDSSDAAEGLGGDGEREITDLASKIVHQDASFMIPSFGESLASLNHGQVSWVVAGVPDQKVLKGSSAVERGYVHFINYGVVSEGESRWIGDTQIARSLRDKDSQSANRFGQDVAVLEGLKSAPGDTLVLGSMGEVFLIDPDGLDNFFWDGLWDVRDIGALRVISGPSSESFGTVLHADGDLNGDGYPDLLVGAPGSTASTGRVYLFTDPLGATDFSHADRVFGGPSDDSEFGVALSTGDMNGDGLDDLAVGAPGYNQDRGQVVIYAGDAEVDDMAVFVTINGEDQVALGASLDMGGDLHESFEGHSFPDLLIGAPGADSFKGEGRVYILLGLGQ